MRNVYAPHISESIRRHARELEISDLDTTGRIQQILTDTLRSDGTQGTHVWNWNFYPLYILLLLLFSIFTRPLENVSSSSQNFAPQSAHPSVEVKPALLGCFQPHNQPSVRMFQLPRHLLVVLVPGRLISLFSPRRRREYSTPKGISIRTGPHRLDGGGSQNW